MGRTRTSLSVLLSVVLMMTVLVPVGAAAQEDEPQVLVFSATAGFRHGSIEAGVAAVESLGDQHGFAVDATENAGDFTEENLAGYDAVVWLSTTGSVLNVTQQAAFESYIQDGGGFVGIHAASDTHYDWPWYGGLVGAYFQSHPPGTQTADLMVYDSVHPSTEMLPAVWERHDEWYDFNLNPRGDVHVLAGIDESSYEDDVTPGPQMGWDHPIAWCQPYDGGRSWYTAGGHTNESFAEEPFLEHIAGGILWAAGVVEGDCSATIWDNFDKETLAQGPGEVGEPMGLAVLPDGRVLHTSRADGAADPRITPMNPVNGLGHVYLTDVEAGETVEVAEIPVYRFSEFGVQGIALDPDFEDNGWVYLYYTPEVPGIPEGEAPRNGDGPEDFEEFEGHNNLSRFQFTDGDAPELDLDSEQVLLEVEQNLGLCCHMGGDIDFDSDGNLYLSTGDNTHFDSSDNYSPHDDRETRNPGFDARRTSGNTNNLAGKLLRITPQADGSYTVPDDNMFTSGEFDDLFPDGEYDEELARPEIYAMGLRNPFRFSVDPVTDLVYLGDYGPDAGSPNPNRGPQNTVSWHVIDEPVNIGWPYCIGNNFAYNFYDWTTSTSGDPFDCEGGPTNDSRHNTGLEQLPPVTPATIWYHYDQTPEFPQLGTGGGAPMGGPAYHYDADAAAESDVAWPEYYDGIPLLYEWSRNWIKQIHLDDDLSLIDITETVPNIGLSQPMDMEFGPDGALYVLEYAGGFFAGSPNAALSRITYGESEDAPPPPAPGVVGALPCIGFTSDDFEGVGELDRDRWSEIVRENPDGYRVADGALHIDTGDGTDMYGGNTTAENLILQPAPSDAWQITTELELELGPKEWEQAGLIVYGSDADFAKLSFIQTPNGRQLEFILQQDGTPVDGGTDDRTEFFDEAYGDTVHLRITSDGTNLTASWSEDGDEFTDFGRPRALSSIPDPHIGVAAFNGAGDGNEASFEHVTVSVEPDGVDEERSDDFEGGGQLDRTRWSEIVRENPDGYRLGDGALHIETGDGTDMFGGSTNAENLILQPAPTGAWQITTELELELTPDRMYEQAGLMVYGNDANFVKLSFIQHLDGRLLEFTLQQNGSAIFDSDLDTIPVPDTVGDTVHIRIASDGLHVVGSWSEDGVEFTEFGRERTLGSISNPHVGLAAFNGEGDGNEASFEHFTLTPDPDALADTRSDDFDGDELDGCRWDRVVRHNPDLLEVSGGQLHLEVPNGDIFQDTNTEPDNFILQSGPQGDYVMETSFHAPFEEQYQQAGLIVYDDQANWVKLNVVTDNPPGQNRQLRVEFASEINDQIVQPHHQISPAPDNPDDQWWVRLERSGSFYTGWISVDGEEWIEVGQVVNNALTSPGIGIYTLGHEQTDSVTVSFDYFSVDPDEFDRVDPGQPGLECGAPVIEDGYTALWDGESLDGWNMAGPGLFDIVEDDDRDGGCALETIGGMGLLWHEDELGSYRFQTDFKPQVSEANSGVFVGFPDPGTDPWVAVDNGYEIQIDDFGAGDPPGQDINRTGAIYSFQEPTSFPTVIGEWNTLEIEVDDPFIRVWINDELVNEFEDPDGSGRDLSSGYLGLQNHPSSSGLVQFRDVQVVDFDDGPIDPDELTVEIELDPADPDGDNDWYVSPVTMTLSSDHPDAQLEWRFEGDEAWTAYSDPVTFDEDGVTEVEARAVVAGDEEPDAPSEVDVAVGGNGNVFTPNDITVAQGGTITYQLIDGFHDVVTEDEDGNVIDASPLGTSWGTHEFTATQPGTFRIFCTPHASLGMVGTVTVEPASAPGDVSEIESVSFALDQAPPETSASLAGDSTGDAYVGEVTVTLDASDETSGVAQTSYRIDGGDEQSYDGAFTVSGEGSHTVEFQSTDVAGNVEAWQEVSFDIVELDPNAPSIEASLDPADPDGENGWYVSPVTLTLVSDDGDATLEWRAVGAADWVAYTDPVVFDADGTYELQARAVNDAGPSLVASVAFDLDATPPETAASLAGEQDGDAYVGDVTLTLEASDETSGVAETHVREAGAEGHDVYVDPVTFTGEGSYVVEFRSVDVAGNVEGWQSVGFQIGDGGDGPTDPPGEVCSRHQGGASFPDAAGSGHRSFIDCLAELGVVQGHTDGMFRPADDVSRGQLASFVVRAIELSTGATMEAGGELFPDVGVNSTHGPAIYKLRNAGIIQGYTDGTFRSQDPVTRDQTARYVVNALEFVLGASLPTSGASFPDVAAGSLYAADIDKLVTAQVIGGFTDGTFGPRQNVTRGQMTRFIGNALEVLAAEGAYHGP